MKLKYLINAFLFVALAAQAQVKIGDNPTVVGQSSLLELESASKGLVLPRVQGTSGIALPVEGMMIYDLSSHCIKVYSGSAWSGCLSAGAQVSSGTAVITSVSCSGVSQGTLTVGKEVEDVTQKINVTVGVSGSYYVTATSNGITFVGAGMWSSQGAYEVTLYGSGTPLVAGTSTFSLNTNPQCTFTRSVGLPFQETVCSTSYGEFPATAVVNSTTVTITKPATNNATNSVGQCGISTTAAKTVRIYYNQNATFNLSVPLKNVQVYLSGVNGSQDNEGVSVSATLNGVAVPVQLVKFGGTCTTVFTETQVGGTGILKNNTNSGNDTAVVFNISSAGLYDKLIVSRDSTDSSGSIYVELMTCNASTTL